MKKFSFTKNTKIFFGIVLVMIIIGVASFFIRGFNLDIDFIGGTEIAYDLGRTVTKADEADIEKLIIDTIGNEKYSRLGVSDNQIVTVRTIVTDNKNNEAEIADGIVAGMAELFADATYADTKSSGATVVFTKAAAEETEEDAEPAEVWSAEDTDAVKAMITELGGFNPETAIDGEELTITFESSNEVGEMREAITAAITEKYEGAKWVSGNTVSANVSSSLKRSAIIATILAVVLMLIYIAIRFQISSAFAAIICLTHDLFITLVAYSLFQIPVNSNIIAALLTILGYSINATIIIFDRIRENEAKMGSGVPFAEKVDAGIRSTITRSINTTLTTLFTIGMIYILGVESIKAFALPLIVGIIAGLFSSVCLAGPIWNLLKKVGKKK